jgi:hypothetical protein
MLTIEARRGPWSLTADYAGLEISGAKGIVKSVRFGDGEATPLTATLDVGSTLALDASVFSVSVSRCWLESRAVCLDLFLGIRNLALSAKADWRLSTTVPDGSGGTRTLAATGHIEDDESDWDGIVGLAGRLVMEGPWALPFSVDVGAGSSKLTWQVILGLSCSAWWGDVVIGYRKLSLDPGDDEFVENMTLGGPLLAATWYF